MRKELEERNLVEVYDLLRAQYKFCEKYDDWSEFEKMMQSALIVAHAHGELRGMDAELSGIEKLKQENEMFPTDEGKEDEQFPVDEHEFDTEPYGDQYCHQD